ncbi:MAG: hypothetical protein U0074_10785 [Kouleothrix sp.]
MLVVAHWPIAWRCRRCRLRRGRNQPLLWRPAGLSGRAVARAAAKLTIGFSLGHSAIGDSLGQAFLAGCDEGIDDGVERNILSFGNIGNRFAALNCATASVRSILSCCAATPTSDCSAPPIGLPLPPRACPIPLPLPCPRPLCSTHTGPTSRPCAYTAGAKLTTNITATGDDAEG